MDRYACPCCAYLTFESIPDGSFEMCPVCWWEDDPVQLDDPDYEGGANRVSLNQARRNFKKWGAIEERFRDKTRLPALDEIPSK